MTGPRTVRALPRVLLAISLIGPAAAAAGERKTYTVEPAQGSELDPSFTVDAAELSAITRATFTISAHVDLEVDRISGVGAIPSGQTPPAGGTFDLADIFEAVGITVDVDHDDVNIPDLSGATGCYSSAELTSLLNANRDQTPPANGGWQTWAGMVTCHDAGLLGVMWQSFTRDGFAVFEDEFAASGLGDPEILRTTAHELGHALNLYHDDGDDGCSGLDTGTTIMNRTGDLDSNWRYGFSAASRAHFDGHPDPSVEPGTATPFCSCTASHFCGYNGC